MATQNATLRPVAPQDDSSRKKFANLVFFLAILCSLLPSAPIVTIFNGLSPIPVQGPLIIGWLLLIPAPRLAGGPIIFAVAVGLSGMIATAVNEPNSQSWWTYLGALVVPLVVLCGLQALHDEEVRRAGFSVAIAATIAAMLQVFTYAQAAGGLGGFSPSAVLGNHTDVGLWASAGARVLGNPNNASLIYCTAFAFAIRALLGGQHRKAAVLGASVSGLAIWVTGSRGAMLTMLLVLIFAVTVGTGRKVRVLPALISGLGALWLIMTWLESQQQTAATEQSWAARLETRRAAVESLVEQPWGFGAGRVAEGIAPRLNVTAGFGGDQVGATGHDMFLNWALAIGVVAMVLLLGCLWVALRNQYRAGGVIAALPLLAFVISGQSAGIDLVNSTNPAWSIMFMALLGLALRREGGGFSKPVARGRISSAPDLERAWDEGAFAPR